VKVMAYWNLHKGMWSVKALEGPDKGRVIMRTEQVLLTDVESKVSEAGRQRVLRERKKNVHAGMVGQLVERTDHRWEDFSNAVQQVGLQVTYNPYKYTTFVYKNGEVPFDGSFYALLTPWGRVFVA
jgi:hypothetical protein